MSCLLLFKKVSFSTSMVLPCQDRQSNLSVHAGGHRTSKRRIGRQRQLGKTFAGRVDQIHAEPRSESPALAHDWRAGLPAMDR